MAIIKFENGIRVKFDGNPTQKDVEEMAANLKLQSSVTPTAQNDSRLSPDVSTYNPEKVKKVSDFIGTTKLGQGIGQTISNLFGGQKQVTNTQDDLIDTQSKLFKRIEADREQGKDTTRLESALKFLTDEIQGIGATATDLGTGGLTNKEVIGSALKTGTTIAAAGLNPAQSIAGKAAQFGTLGASGGAADALIENKSPEDIAKDTLKKGAIGAGTGIAFGVAEKGLKFLGNFLGKTGDRIQTSVIKPSQADVKDGFNIETVKKYNLGGSLKQTLEKTDSKLDSLSKELAAKIGSSKNTLDLNDVYENTARKLLGGKFENFGSNKAMENAIENLRSEIIASAGNNGIVSLPEAQLVKRASGHFGAWTYGIPTPEATASQKVYNTFYNELKTAIEKNSPEGIKELNKQISELIPVMNAVIRRIPVAERNNALSLTDIISLTAASLEPRALSISLMNLASKSGRVGSFLSKNASNAGEAVSNGVRALEKAGQVGVSR